MTQNKLIEMADKAHGPITTKWWDMDVASLERFAKMVAESEREECAKQCDNIHFTVDSGNNFAKRIRARGKT